MFKASHSKRLIFRERRFDHLKMKQCFNPRLSCQELRENDVHIWSISFSDVLTHIQEFYKTLDSTERIRAGRYHLPKERARFIGCRGMLRSLLGNYLKIDAAQVNFSYGLHGKPLLKNTCGEKRLHFNLAYSNDLILAAFTLDSEIGVDLEYVEEIPELNWAINTFFSENECAVFQTLPVSQWTDAFYHCWTRKEAFIKAIGNDRIFPSTTFDVSFAPGEPAQLLQIAGNSEEPSHWEIQSLTPALNYVGAIAVRRPNCRMKVYNEWMQQYSDNYKLIA